MRSRATISCINHAGDDGAKQLIYFCEILYFFVFFIPVLPFSSCHGEFSRSVYVCLSLQVMKPLLSFISVTDGDAGPTVSRRLHRVSIRPRPLPRAVFWMVIEEPLSPSSQCIFNWAARSRAEPVWTAEGGQWGGVLSDFTPWTCKPHHRGNYQTGVLPDM